MSLKKMRSKTRKGAAKRIKLTNGDNGKLIINRNHGNHLLIKRTRTRKLKRRRDTVLASVHKTLKSII